MTFDPHNRETWADILHIEEIAVLCRRSISYITRRATVGQFQPAPFDGGGRGVRWQWRKTDVIRFLDGQQTSSPRIRRIA